MYIYITPSLYGRYNIYVFKRERRAVVTRDHQCLAGALDPPLHLPQIAAAKHHSAVLAANGIVFAFGWDG